MELVARPAFSIEQYRAPAAGPNSPCTHDDLLGFLFYLRRRSQPQTRRKE
jgi:hypothetical protein